MMRFCCHCCIFVFFIILMAMQSTLTLFVRKPDVDVDEITTAGDADQEGLGHRPNERDKRSADSMPDSFVFPDQLPKKPQFVVPNTDGPPPCARGDTFCESVDEYPAEHVIKLLKKEPLFLRRFFQDDQREYSFVDDNLEDRIDASDENPLCIAREHIVYPKMAKNIEGNWLFVINQDEYKQGVRVEKCVKEGECSFPASLPLAYHSQCKQKYIYRKLVALNGTGQGVITDSFPLPSCCSCVIRFERNGSQNRVGGAAPLPLTLPKTKTTTPLP